MSQSPSQYLVWEESMPQNKASPGTALSKSLAQQNFSIDGTEPAKIEEKQVGIKTITTPWFSL